MVTDKQLALRISQSYKSMAEIAKGPRQLGVRSEGFIYLAVIAIQTDRSKLHQTAPSSQSAESGAWCRMPRRVLISLLTPVPSLFFILVLPVHDRGC